MWEENNRKAVDLFQSGKQSEAIALVEAALNEAEEEFGPEDPRVARCLNNLAEMYRVQKRLKQALPLWREISGDPQECSWTGTS